MIITPLARIPPASARGTASEHTDWADVPFEITNQAPERPTITRTPAEPFILPGNTVTMTASAADLDGTHWNMCGKTAPAKRMPTLTAGRS